MAATYSLGLRTISNSMAATSSLVPGKKLCSNCWISLTKPEEPEEENIDSGFQDTSLEWERLNMSVAGFGCSPLKFVSNEDKVGYGKRKLEQVCAAVKDKVAVALDLEIDLIEKKEDKAQCCQKGKDLDGLMDMVRDKVKFSKRKDQLKYLTLVPDSWTVEEIEDFFGVVNSITRKSKELQKEKGLVPKIAKKKGKVLLKDIAESVAAFYENNQFSRNCPGKKEFVSVRINGEKVHKQKPLLLINLKELHQEFQKSCNKI